MEVVEALYEMLDPASPGNPFRRERYWIIVQFNPYEEDQRSSTPSIKTEHSFRQLPLSEQMVRRVDEYATNYRGRPRHSLQQLQVQLPPLFATVLYYDDFSDMQLSMAAHEEKDIWTFGL